MWQFKKLLYNNHHSQLPTPIWLQDNIIRVYYSTKIKNKSHIMFLDIKEDTLEPINENKALFPGEHGSFDHDGVMPSCIIDNMLFYTGWHLKQETPYSHSIGIAKILNDGTLKRYSDKPILNHNSNLANSPFVERRNDSWEMLYCKGTGWIDKFPTYHISLAKSSNGIHWEPTDKVIITYNIQEEAISRVCRDSKDNSLYFSWKTKNSKYKISRQDKNRLSDIIIPKSDWDSEMQCYPFIYNRYNYRYLFYNGNQYGGTGIGVAEWIKDIV